MGCHSGPGRPPSCSHPTSRGTTASAGRSGTPPAPPFRSSSSAFSPSRSSGALPLPTWASLLTYDLYRTYINANASGKKILLLSRFLVCVWALVMAIASIVLNEMKVSLGYVYNFMATALGSAVFPVACSIYTDKLDKVFAISGAVLGAICAFVVWLAYAASLEGGLIFSNTADLYAQLYGGLTALLASTFICCIGMVVKPMHFDWQILLDGIKLVSGDGGENTKVLSDDSDGTPEALLAAKSWVFKYGWGLSLLLVVAWPLACVPMGAFAKSTFQIWSGVALMWGYIGSIVIVGLPIYEGSDGLGYFFQKMAGKAPPTKETTTGSYPSETATA